MIRVVLIDDHTLVRRGIKSLLELSGDIQVVAEAADGEEGAEIVRRERPDAILLDIRMPKKDGVALLVDLRQSGELPPAILLTTFDDDESLLAGIKAGARGYLLKDVSLEQLTDAIRTVARGDTLIRPAISERVLRGLEHLPRHFDAHDRPDNLTKREVEVLQADRRWLQQSRDCRGAGHGRRHRQESRIEHLVEAGCARSNPRRLEGD